MPMSFWLSLNGLPPVVTVTAVRDGAAWERLSRRVADGDLAHRSRTEGGAKLFIVD